MVVGASAAVLQGANTATQDIDLWFDRRRHAQHGLGPFGVEWANSFEITLDGVPLRILKLERIIDSIRAAGRKKDAAALPALEEALAVLMDRTGG